MYEPLKDARELFAAEFARADHRAHILTASYDQLSYVERAGMRAIERLLVREYGGTEPPRVKKVRVSARQISEARADTLPCDVRVAPATIISAGCPISTLLECIESRRGMKPAPTFRADADRQRAAQQILGGTAQQALHFKGHHPLSDPGQI